MAEQQKINERLIALVCLGIIAVNYPLLGIFSKKLFILGVPLLYLYLFSIWVLFIIGLALVLRKRHSPTSTSEIGS